MAVVGEAHIIVKALTAGVGGDIQRGFKGAGGAAANAGKSVGEKFSNAFKSSSGGFGDKLKSGMNSIKGEAMKTGKAFGNLQRAGFFLNSGIAVLGSSVGSLIGAIGALGGAALGAAAGGITALIGAFGALIGAMVVGKLALGGVGAAVSALNKASRGGAGAAQAKAEQDALKNLAKVKASSLESLAEAAKKVERAQLDLNKAIEQGIEDIQQLNFAAEDAALSEQGAALDLEKARMTLARVQDMPPNSMARRQAELEYAQAELALRKAKDKSSDVQKEQARIGGDVNKTDVVMAANQDLADAKIEQEKAIVRALQATADAEEAVAEAAKARGKAAADALAALTPSQRTFAIWLSKQKPEFDALKEAAASGFLPLLQIQIGRLISGAFPMLKTGIHEIGLGLGEASQNFTDEFLKPENLASLATVMRNMRPQIAQLGTIFGKAFGILIKLLEIAEPMTKGFLDWLESKADAFSNFLDAKKGTKELNDFFTNANTVMGQFGAIFGNIFKGIGAIIMANFGPGTGGDTMLKWLQTATAGFATMGEGKGAAELQGWFKGAADNAISMFKVLGSIFKVFLDLADDPNIKKFWDTLGEATPAIERIVTAGLEAAPVMAELFVNVGNIMAAFADSETPKMFFGILSTVAKAVSDFFNSKFMQSILSVTGPIHGVFLALGTLALAFKLVGFYIAYLGFQAKMIWGVLKVVFGWIWKFLGMIGRAVMFVGRMIGLAFSANPLGAIITAIALVVAALVWFFTQTKIGRELWANFMKFLSEAWENIVKFFTDVFNGFAEWFAGIWDSIKGFVQPVLDFFVGLFKIYIDIWIGIFNGFVAFFKAIWDGIVFVVKFAIDIIVAIFKVWWDIVSVIIGIIVGIFKFAFAIILTVVTLVWMGIQAGFKAVADFLTPILNAIFGFFSTVFTNIGNFVKGVWDGLVAAFQIVANFIKPILDGIFGFFKTVFTNIGNFFKGVWDGIIKAVKFIGGVFENVWNGIVGFFKGAINGLIGMAEGFVNFFINGLNFIISMINKLKFKVPDFVPFIGGQEIGFNLKPIGAFKLPRLADGGVVMPSSGGSIVNVAEAGRSERIEPLDSSGLSVRDRALIELIVKKNEGTGSGAPVNINVVATPEMDKSELAAEIGRVLQLQMRRGARA